jgi:hypothetical protein
MYSRRFASSLIEGRLPETIQQAERGVASPAAARTAAAGGQGFLRRALGLADQVADGSGLHSRKRQRRSPAENRHGGAPREVPFATGQAGPKGSDVAPRKRDKIKECPVGAPSTPHRGNGIAVVATAAGGKARMGSPTEADSEGKCDDDDKTRAHKRAAGTKNTALFDIVRRIHGAVMVAPESDAVTPGSLRIPA